MLSRKTRSQIIELIETVRGGLVCQNIDKRAAMLDECIAALSVSYEIIQKELSYERSAQYDDTITTVKAAMMQLNENPDSEEIAALSLQLIDWLLNKMREEPVKKEIFFLPYKASMWDSLESVWKAAVEDEEHCNVYVVPIPYCDRNPDGSAGKWHCDAHLFPKEVHVIDWRNFTLKKLKEHQPDAIFIHNPYDDENFVTSVDKQYYSRELKNVTKHLYYIPYYSTTGGMAEGQAMLPAYNNVEAIFVQAERLIGFFDESVRHKIYPLGSPKFDSVIHLCQNPPAPPKGWAEKMKGKKVYFYNTSLGGMLADTEAFFKKMKYVFRTFAGREDACLLWRPHPLMMSTLETTRRDAVPFYEKLRDYFISNDIGIYDDTPMIETAIAWSDVYVGDTATSVTSLFGIAGKPIFALDNHIHELPAASDWIGRAFQWFADDYGEWVITWNNCLFHSIDGNHHFEFYCRLHEDQDGSYYNRVIVKNGKIYVLPVNIQQILVIQDRKIIKTIPLRQEDDRGGLFAGARLVKDKIFLIPMRYPFMVCLDTKTDTVSYIDGLKGITSVQINDVWMVGGSCVFNNKLYMSSIINALQLIIDPDTLSVEAKDLEPNRLDGGFNVMFPEGDDIWLYAVQGQEIWRWSTKDNSVKKYCGFPEGFTCHHPDLHYQCDIMPIGSTAYTKDYLYIVPMWGNQFIKLNKATGEISRWDAPFEASNETTNGYLRTWGVGGFIWGGLECNSSDLEFIHLPTRKMYHVNLDDNIWEEIPLSFDKESLQHMEIGYDRMSKWFLYGCIENAFNSLKDLLDGNIHGKPFNREKQLKEYSDIAANNDGTAGEKIYDFAMKQMTMN